MLRKTPPLESLEAFLAIVREGGVRKAAPKLALTPSGVSRRLVALEHFIDRPLFDRTSAGLQLNASGRSYFDAIESSLETIRAASFPERPFDGRIVVATSHSFANRWLAPRMPELSSATGLEIEIMPTRDAEAVRSGKAQFGIWGALDVSGLRSEVLLKARAKPVSCARLADGRHCPRALSELNDYPLLTVIEPEGLWERWFATAGLDYAPTRIVPFPTLSLMYEAALAGAGVALAIPMLCESALASGSLVTCGPALSIDEAYRLYRQPRNQCQTLSERKFLNWIRREVALSDSLFSDLANAA